MPALWPWHQAQHEGTMMSAYDSVMKGLNEALAFATGKDIRARVHVVGEKANVANKLKLAGDAPARPR